MLTLHHCVKVETQAKYLISVTVHSSAEVSSEVVKLHDCMCIIIKHVHRL